MLPILINARALIMLFTVAVICLACARANGVSEEGSAVPNRTRPDSCLPGKGWPSGKTRRHFPSPTAPERSTPSPTMRAKRWCSSSIGWGPEASASRNSLSCKQDTKLFKQRALNCLPSVPTRLLRRLRRRSRWKLPFHCCRTRNYRPSLPTTWSTRVIRTLLVPLPSLSMKRERSAGSSSTKSSIPGWIRIESSTS